MEDPSLTLAKVLIAPLYIKARNLWKVQEVLLAIQQTINQNIKRFIKVLN
jgi:hypothetical protein